MKKQVQIISTLLTIVFSCYSIVFPSNLLSPPGTLFSKLTETLSTSLSKPAIIPLVQDDKQLAKHFKFGLLKHKNVELVTVIGSDPDCHYINPADGLPSGNLLARRIKGDASKEGHRSDIVLLVPVKGNKEEILFREDRVIIKNAEDPRIMFFDGKIGMTFTALWTHDVSPEEFFRNKNRRPFVFPKERTKLFNSYFVFINEQGIPVDSHGEEVDVLENYVDRDGIPLMVDSYGIVSPDPYRIRLGCPTISSKNAYITKLSDGRYALVDRPNNEFIRTSIQRYIFDTLADLLYPPADYWQRDENSIAASTILTLIDILVEDDKWNILGINTILERIQDDFKIAIIHRGKFMNDDPKNKIYRVEMVLLSKDTLKPLGKPIPLLDPHDYKMNSNGHVHGVFYPSGARIVKKSNKDMLRIYLGVDDSYIFRFEESLDKLIQLFFEAQTGTEEILQHALEVASSAVEVNPVFASSISGKKTLLCLCTSQ